jgi:hypothetical protein
MGFGELGAATTYDASRDLGRLRPKEWEDVREDEREMGNFFADKMVSGTWFMSSR